MTAACFTLSEPWHQWMIQNVIRRSNNKNQSPSNKSQHLEIGVCLFHCTARRYDRDEGANTQYRLCFLDGCQLLLSHYAISCHCSRNFRGSDPIFKDHIFPPIEITGIFMGIATLLVGKQFYFRRRSNSSAGLPPNAMAGGPRSRTPSETTTMSAAPKLNL